MERKNCEFCLGFWMVNNREASAAAAANAVRWYVLGENQEHVGPYAVSELREHFFNGYIFESTLLWAEERNEWMTLSSIPDLYIAMSNQRPDNNTSACRYTKDEDDFEKWQKEIKEAEAAAEALKNGTKASVSGPDGVALQEGAESGNDDAPASPPDGEDEFTDDDGSVYKWDHGLRKWVPQSKTILCLKVWKQNQTQNRSYLTSHLKRRKLTNPRIVLS